MMFRLVAAAWMLAAPAAMAGGEDAPPAPPTSSPALAAVAPELAAVPGLVLVGYPVDGASPRAIRESINENRPDDGGEHFDGRAQYVFSYTVMQRPDGECDPATAEVAVAHTVTLPELRTRARLGRRERNGWDRYFSALVAHEHNHVRIAEAGAEQLRTFMRQAPNCATMNAARERIQAAVREAQAAYDRDTHHGRTEGATYP